MASLRELLERDEPLVAPGATSALFAKLIEEAGFPAVYMTGAGVSHAYLGEPDLGLTTLTEMAQQVESLAGAVSAPVIADADTGFGGVLNVRRTVRLYEARGAAAIQLEDQVVPKRCGHFEGKEVVAVEEMLARLRAALEARRDPDTLIVARTDARAALGLEEAIERGHAYAEAGADVVFVEAPQSGEELERIGRELGGEVPLLANMVEGGKTPQLTAQELYELGFSIVIFPGLLTRVAVKAARDALAVLRAEGDSRPLLDRVATFADVNDLLDLDAVNELAARLERGEAPLAK
jgi:2-methylisocitrate lyase-like PEP mutase family enzyme